MFRIFTGFFLNGPNLSAIKHSDWIGLPHFLDTPHPSIELSELRITEWLLKKRIDGLVKFGFLIQNNNKLLVKSLTIVSIIKLSEIYKDLLKIGKGGV